MSIAAFLLAAASPIGTAPPSEAPRKAMARTRGTLACRVLLTDAAPDAAITTGMIVAAPCGDAPPAALRYDRASGTVRAVVALPAGTYLGRVAVAASAGIAKGSALRLISTAGPVRVQRQVTVLQSSRGTRVFVRDADGQVFAAPLVLEETK